MNDVADYDTDILLWSERQAQLIRDLKTGMRGLPNELDLENVAEEIESVGRSELGSVKSQLGNSFLHLIKLASSPSTEPMPHWLDEVRSFRRDLLVRISPSMFQRIDLDRIWASALRDAAASFADFDQQIAPFPSRCPFELTEIASEDFNPRDAMERLKALIVPPENVPTRRGKARRRG